ncbi:MAG: class I SAM-dependent methyltransferase [Thermoleophilaceae bacterium]|nr:class I SAM-dependent methyltransferase [Thermoleophilaceae bacterium]
MLISPAERLRRLADDGDADSLSRRLRERRFRLFDSLVARLGPPISILDVGGTVEFWERRGWADRPGVSITLLNLGDQDQRHDNVRPMVGDATNLADFADGQFDVAFSNSVIEHLFSLEAQSRMAHEVQRVAKAHWVQTPNFWFPVEPHFLVPAWHWLPEDARVAILRRRGVGWAGRCPDADFAREIVREHRLMRRAELSRLFPSSRIVPERMFGLVKSWIAIRGFPAAS